LYNFLTRGEMFGKVKLYKSRDAWAIATKGYKEYREKAQAIHNSALFILNQLLDKAKPRKGRPTFVCPFCGRGSDDNSRKQGMEVTDIGGYYCFTCNAQGKDIIELYQAINPNSNFTEAVEKLYGYISGGDVQQVKKPVYQWTPPPPKEKIDFYPYFQQVRARIADTVYHRGITMDTLVRFWVGYDESWVSPTVIAEQKAKGSLWTPAPSPRLIVPTSRYTYLARRTDGREGEKDYPKMYEGERYPFNIKVVRKYPDTTVFVVEGEIDALSLEDIGVRAIGLGGSSAKRIFLKLLKVYGHSGKLIFLADSDEKKDKDFQKVAADVRAMGITCDFVQGAEVLGSAKDCNEFLQADREGFKRSVTQWIN
jgi:replicative DNA helicase